MCGELSLGVGRGGHCISGRLERGEERVALRVDDPTVVRGDRSAKKAPVVGERLVVAVVAELLEQRRRSLDVREEKGDCSCRQVLHNAQFSSITSRRQSAPDSRKRANPGKPAYDRGPAAHVAASRPLRLCRPA